MFGIFGIGVGLLLSAFGGAGIYHVAEHGLCVQVPSVIESK